MQNFRLHQENNLYSYFSIDTREEWIREVCDTYPNLVLGIRLVFVNKKSQTFFNNIEEFNNREYSVPVIF